MNPFRTSDIAEFLGITNMGVHYLEKHGFLTSERGENGYRAYSVETVTRLGILKGYERMGFTLQEARRMMEEKPDAVKEALAKRRAEILRQLEMVDWQLNGLEDGNAVGEDLTEENCRIVMSPHMYYCPVWEEAYDMEKVDVLKQREMRDIDISWMAAMPFMKYCSKLSFEDDKLHNEKGNCIFFDKADSVLLNGLTEEVPSVSCLSFRYYGMREEELIGKAKKFLRRKGMEAVFPAYEPIWRFSESSDSGFMLKEIFIPIKNSH